MELGKNTDSLTLCRLLESETLRGRPQHFNEILDDSDGQLGLRLTAVCPSQLFFFFKYMLLFPLTFLYLANLPKVWLRGPHS